MTILSRNNWLRYRVKSIIRNKHHGLYKTFWRSSFKNLKEYACDKNRWWLILIGVIIVFILAGLININFLNIFYITVDTAKLIVDQRAGNIAAIISITLVVVGFLISNLALKEAVAYRLLFKHSYLYPIIFFTLSTIGCFFIISILRDEITPEYFIRFVIVGTYLALLILFLIGFLFKTIIQFTNDKIIRQLLHDELMIEAKKNLKRILIRKYSGELFKYEMAKLGAIEQSWTDSLSLAAVDLENKSIFKKNTIETNHQDSLIIDLNLKSINRLVINKKKFPEKILYQPIALDTITSNYLNYIWQEGRPNTDKEKSILKKSIVIKRITDDQKDPELVKKYFDQKLAVLVSTNEHQNLEDLLMSFYELYELQIRNQR